jgi:hypothetical protein
MQSLLVTPIARAAALVHPAQAAETIPCGFRIAMAVTVTDRSGPGTADAVIRVTPTRARARTFCVAYANDRLGKSVQDALHEPGPKDVLTGSCKADPLTRIETFQVA